MLGRQEWGGAAGCGGWSHCVHGKDTGRNSWQYPASFSLIGSGTPACNSATHIQGSTSFICSSFLETSSETIPEEFHGKSKSNQVNTEDCSSQESLFIDDRKLRH